jgi:hypothetical protein
VAGHDLSLRLRASQHVPLGERVVIQLDPARALWFDPPSGKALPTGRKG